jgi:hypothetical protein
MKLKKPSEGLVKIGYPADPLLYALQIKAGDLAALWGETKDEKYVKQYHAVIKCLIALGWETDLDADAELPDDLMPKEYFEHVERLYKDVETAPIPK